MNYLIWRPRTCSKQFSKFYYQGDKEGGWGLMLNIYFNRCNTLNLSGYFRTAINSHLYGELYEEEQNRLLHDWWRRCNHSPLIGWARQTRLLIGWALLTRPLIGREEQFPPTNPSGAWRSKDFNWIIQTHMSLSRITTGLQMKICFLNNCY